jgi:hypothetical protein
VVLRAVILRQFVVGACLAMLFVVLGCQVAGAKPLASWSEGQSVLLGANDARDMPYASPPSDTTGLSQVLQPCAHGNPLLAEIASGGRDVAVGSTYSNTPPNVEGGLGVGSIAFRGDASSAATLDGLLSSVPFWSCVQQQQLHFARSAGLNYRAVQVARLSPTDGLGVATTTAMATRRVTSDATHTPFSDHIDLVAIRVGNNVVLLWLENNDGAFPDALRAQLSTLTEQRLQRLAGTARSANPTRTPNQASEAAGHSSSGSNVGLIVALVCVVVGVILLAVFLLRRRRGALNS